MCIVLPGVYHEVERKESLENDHDIHCKNEPVPPDGEIDEVVRYRNGEEYKHDEKPSLRAPHFLIRFFPEWFCEKV